MKKLYLVCTLLLLLTSGCAAFFDRDLFVKGVVTAVDPQLNSISLRLANGVVRNLILEEYSVEIDGMKSDISQLKIGSTVGIIYEIDDDTKLAEDLHIVYVSK